MIKKTLKALFIIIFLSVFAGFYIYLNAEHQTPIMMYHSIDKKRVKSYAAVGEKSFYRQMKILKDNNYQIVLLDDYCRMLKDNKPIPKNTAVITFDDGYKDNLNAVRILNQFDFPATIFLVAGELGKEGYLSKEDVTWVLNNSKVRFGSHTLTHAYLPKLTGPALRREVLGSKKTLESTLGTPIEAFCFPSGGFNEAVLQEVKDAGYLCACTTNRGFFKKSERFSLRRIKITNSDAGITLRAKLSGFYNFFKKPKSPS